MMKTIFQCEDNFEGILCGVYDAWSSGFGHENVCLRLLHGENLELFACYQEVTNDSDKAMKVITSVKKKLSETIYEMIYKVSLSCNPEKADIIYRFLIDAFRYGKGTINMLKLDSVFRIFELDRNISNEIHQQIEFVRFSKTDSGVLISRITPKNNVLTMLVPHFADRLSGENWMIYDLNRSQAVFFRANQGWILASLTESQIYEASRLFVKEDDIKNLWRTFFKAIAIEERRNERCQRNHLPLRYRGNMVEFTK